MEPVVRNSRLSFLTFAFYWLPHASFLHKMYVQAAEGGRCGELYLFPRGESDLCEGDVWMSHGLSEEGRSEGEVGVG